MGVHFCHPVAIQDGCWYKDVCVWQCPWHRLLGVPRPLWGEQGVLGVEALCGQKLLVWEDPFIGHTKLLGHDPLRRQHPVLGHGPDGTARPVPVVGLLRHFDDVDRERAPGCQVGQVPPPHVVFISLFVSCGKGKGTVRCVRALSHGVKRGRVQHTALEQPPGETQGTIYQQLDRAMDIHIRVLPVREMPALCGMCHHGLMADRESYNCMQTGTSPSAMHHTFSHHDTTDSVCCRVQTVVLHYLHEQQVMEKLSNVTFTIHLWRKHREGELRQSSSPFEETHTSFLASGVDMLWNPSVPSSHFWLLFLNTCKCRFGGHGMLSLRHWINCLRFHFFRHLGCYHRIYPMERFFLSLLILCFKWSLGCTGTQNKHTHTHPPLFCFQTDVSVSERMLAAADVPWYITSVLQQLE